MKPLLTVLTTSFNRADLLRRLHESLKAQSDQDFEWVLVDDGSADGTPSTVEDFNREGAVRLHSVRTENRGQHRAINTGLTLAQGELTLLVGNDDYLDREAVALIRRAWEGLRSDPRCAGVCFRKQDLDTGLTIGKALPAGHVDADPVEIIHAFGIIGDKAEAVRTELFRALPYPEIPGEKYYPVGLPLLKLAEGRYIRYFNEVIYYCRYLEGGLSRTLTPRLKANPRGFGEYYRYMLGRAGVPLKARLKFLARLAQVSAYRAIGQAK